MQNPKEVFNYHASHYTTDIMDIKLYEGAIDCFCNEIKNPKARILDLGCGPGNVTEHLLKRHSQYRVCGLDIAENMLALAQMRNSRASFALMNATDIAQLSQKFDGIVVSFLLPYLSKNKVEKLIADCSKLIMDNGMIYLCTMEGDYEQSGPVLSSSGKSSLVNYYYDQDYLEKTLASNGFALRHIKRVQAPNTDVVDLILIASKNN